MMSIDQLAPIQFLSQEVRGQLRSGIATPSVVQCVEELVVNSIDAGASCIAVRVDLPDCKIQVVDNGRGITKDDMSFVGERYATSKCHDAKDLENISYYGYRGEAIASIRDISSVLEISSRARGCEVTYSKLYRHGKDQGISKDPKMRPSGGTTVTAHNVFYNLPVRRKMLSSPLVYEQICKQLQAIALIHPQISLTLRNDSTGVKSIQTHSASSSLKTFGQLYGKELADCLKDVSHVHSSFSMSGFIGTTSHRNKSLQFLYVNGRLVLKTKLHKLVNEILSNSIVTKSKGQNREAVQGGISTKLNTANCQPSPGGNQVEYGIFVLNITCSRNEYDITLDPSKTLVEFRDWEGALTCMHAMVTSFLQREHLTMKITPQIRTERGLQDCDSLSNEDAESKGISVLVSDISTTDCRNAVQSTCVRRQCSGIKESAYTQEVVKDNCDAESAIEIDGEGDTCCKLSSNESNKLPKSHIDAPPNADGDTDLNTVEFELTQSDSVEAYIHNCGANVIDRDKEKSLSRSEINLENSDVIMPSDANIKVSDASPLSTTPDYKNVNVDLSKKQSETRRDFSCNEEECQLKETLSPDIDACSSEETLTSSEVELGTPESNTHHCCDAKCMSVWTDDSDSGHEFVDLVSPRTKLAVKARNSLSMFRRSIKKKKLGKTLEGESAKKSRQNVFKPLQFVTPSEHKTVALRWHRSPGFRNRLEGLNVKCQDRQDMKDTPMMGILNGNPISTNKNSEVNNNCDDDKFFNDISRNEPPQGLEQVSILDDRKPDDHQEHLSQAETPKTTEGDEHAYDLQEDIPTGTTIDLVDVLFDDKGLSKNKELSEEKVASSQEVAEAVTVDASSSNCPDIFLEEYCMQDRERRYTYLPPISKNPKPKPLDNKKRAGEDDACPVTPKVQKKAVLCTRTLNSTSAVEVTMRFLTSTSFMMTAYEVFGNKEPSNNTDYAAGCIQSNKLDSDERQDSNERQDSTIKEADETFSNLSRNKHDAALQCNETEALSEQFDKVRGNLCSDVNKNDALKEVALCPVIEGDAHSGNHHGNETSSDAEDKQSSANPYMQDLHQEASEATSAKQNTASNTVHDASDLDESISLFHVPHHNEEYFLDKTNLCRETICLSSEEIEDRIALSDDKVGEITSITGLSSSVIIAQNSNESENSIDLTTVPEISSALQDKTIDETFQPEEADKMSPNTGKSSGESEPACQSTHVTRGNMTDSSECSAGRTDAEFVMESREWYSVYDATRGVKVFINRFNGNCQLDKPDEGQMLNQNSESGRVDAQFTMVTKSDTLAHPHLPHNAAPFVSSLQDRKETPSSSSNDAPLTPGTMATLDAAMEESQEEDDELANIKWGSLKQFPEKIYEVDGATQLTSSEIGIGNVPPAFSNGLSNPDAKFQAKILGSLNPHRFTKSMFSSIKVLGQVDAKFIACLVNSDQDKYPAGEPNLLILIDQHAAHERIRLEMLIQDAYGNRFPDDGVSKDERFIRSSDITPALSVSLSPSELRLIEAYAHKLKRIGIQYTLSADSVLVTHLPACVVEKEATELKRGRQTIATSTAETLIKEVLDTLQHHSGAVSSLPKTITRILNSQACHGAIKFGDSLALDECKTLIGQLSSCDLPFQCAHGRPALMPILNFRKLKLRNSEALEPSKPQVWKLKYLTSGK